MLTAILIYLIFSLAFHIGRRSVYRKPLDRSLSSLLAYVIAVPLSIPFALGKAVQIYIFGNSN